MIEEGKLKFLIIGASGFIGDAVYKEVLLGGHNAIGTKYSSKNKYLIFYDMLNQSISEVLGNDQIEDIDVAIICSAIPKIDRCFNETELTNRLNVERTCQLVDCFREKNIKTIFISSDAVFDGTKGYYDENDIINPLHQYGVQKAQVERYILKNNLNDVVVRIGLVVGQNDDGKHIFSQWYRNIRAGESIQTIKGQIISPTYVEDIGKALIMICENQLVGLYHVSNSEYFERTELARQFSYILDSHVNIEEKELSEFGFQEKRPLKTYLDSSKFRSITNMQYRSMKSVIKKFII